MLHNGSVPSAVRRGAPFAAPLLLVSLAAAACAPQAANGAGDGAGAAAVELTASPAQARPGGTVTIRLSNRSEHQIGYNLCVTALDRREGADWRPYPQPLVEACTMELRILEPGSSADFRHTLPATLPAGSYRFRTSVESPLGAGMVGVASDPVTVTGAE